MILHSCKQAKLGGRKAWEGGYVGQVFTCGHVVLCTEMMVSAVHMEAAGVGCTKALVAQMSLENASLTL